jgi:hypothetical protein
MKYMDQGVHFRGVQKFCDKPPTVLIKGGTRNEEMGNEEMRKWGMRKWLGLHRAREPAKGLTEELEN